MEPTHDAARFEAFRRELRPVANVETTLDTLTAAGVAVCVASQARLQKTQLTLGLTGLASYFPPHARFSADQVAHGKPAPDLFLFAADSMGYPPAECVVVEDSPLGVVAAVRARTTVYGYADNENADTLTLAGAYAFENMAALPDLLRISA